MTQMKRKLKQSPFRFFRAVLIAICALTMALLLFQLDKFHSNRRERNSTPQEILMEQRRNKLLAAQHANAKDDEDEGVPPDLPEHPEHRQFVMTLAGLQGETSRHEIIFETRYDWAPLGVAHFEQLVEEANFYDECRFFRCLPVSWMMRDVAWKLV